MTIRTLDDLGDVSGARIFVRVDFNVPLDEGRVADDLRIAATLPTLRELLDRGVSLVLASHLGRPKGEVVEELRITPVADRLAEMLGSAVMALDEVTGDEVEAVCNHIEPGDVAMLENLRFDSGEEANEAGFAGRLAELADGYVDDAFGVAHRSNASISALPELMVASGRPAVAGRLMQREVEVLSGLLHHPEKPYVAVLGGVKVSDKLAAIAALVERVDALLIGGAMAFTFIAAGGGEVGNSTVERDRFDDARAAVRRASELGVLLELPTDVLASSGASAGGAPRAVRADEIPAGLMGLDIGPRTVERFGGIIADAKTVLWNGPMGLFELEPFAAGTSGIATAIANASAFSVVGGGDSLLAVKRAGLEGSFDHLSTGGGASLEFLEGKTLPGIAVLED